MRGPLVYINSYINDIVFDIENSRDLNNFTDASSFDKLKDNKNIELPNLRIKSKHTFHQYVIKVKKNRDRLIEYLTKKNIEVGIHYPKMVINLKPYKKNINKKEFKNCLKYENCYYW